jgi:hypothetical protein
MRKIVLVVGATLGICGTAVAGALTYDTGIYAGVTSQQYQGHDLGIAMRVVPGEMKKMIYYVNVRCYNKQGQLKGTLNNHKTTLPAASINSNQQVNVIYHNLHGNADEVHLNMALNHGKAAGSFKEAFIYDHNGNALECVTPGGQATAAGKVFFAMRVQ